MFSRRSFVLTTVAAAALTACSAEEAASPSVAPASTVVDTVAETTTSITPESTTTVPPESTTTSSSAPTTTEPPPETTTSVPSPPSGVPENRSVEINAGSDLGPWLYIGRWDGSAWQGAFAADGEAVDRSPEPGDAIVITDLERGTRAGDVGATGESCFDGRTGSVITPNAGPPDVPGFGYSAIAVPVVGWPLQPRLVADADADVPAYAAAGVAAFADDDVETQAGEVDQIVVADLDGDGDTESLVVFADESQGAEGGVVDPGFSALLLIDAGSGAARTIAKSFIPLTLAEGESAVYDSYRVLDIVDLNGDGLMEIVVHSWYGEGASVIVYTYDGAAVTEVISTGCGS